MKRRFILQKKSGKGFKDTTSIFTGRIPSQAAKKAATRGHKQIYLREAGTDDIRQYKGSVKKVKLKEDTPFAEKGDTVKQGKAKYIGKVIPSKKKTKRNPVPRRRKNPTYLITLDEGKGDGEMHYTIEADSAIEAKKKFLAHRARPLGRKATIKANLYKEPKYLQSWFDNLKGY